MYVLLALTVAIIVALFVTYVVRATDRRIARQAPSSETTMTADEVAEAAALKGGQRSPGMRRWLYKWLVSGPDEWSAWLEFSAVALFALGLAVGGVLAERQPDWVALPCNPPSANSDGLYCIEHPDSGGLTLNTSALSPHYAVWWFVAAAAVLVLGVIVIRALSLRDARRQVTAARRDARGGTPSLRTQRPVRERPPIEHPPVREHPPVGRFRVWAANLLLAIGLLVGALGLIAAFYYDYGAV